MTSLFEIPERLYPAFLERENFFRIAQVEASGADGAEVIPNAALCCRFIDDDALVAANFGSHVEFRTKFEHVYKGKHIPTIHLQSCSFSVDVPQLLCTPR